jgi:hypothetical protein
MGWNEETDFLMFWDMNFWVRAGQMYFRRGEFTLG